MMMCTAHGRDSVARNFVRVVRANTCLAMNGVWLELYVFGIKMKQNRIVRWILNEQTIFTVFVSYALIPILRELCNEL